MTDDSPIGMYRIGAPPTAPPSPPPPAPRRRRGWEIPVLLVAVVVLLAAGAGLAGIWMARRDMAPASRQTMTVRGSITVPWSGSFLSPTSNECVGKGGYDDLAPGGQVTVTDEKGRVVAVGRITIGQGNPGDACVLLFQVDGVPRGAQFYGVEVTHRGKIQKTEAELLSGTLNLTIG
jgi:serine/threonine-protein kinase